jgi:RNA polymerase sigma factor (sigma-70 family)
MQYTNRTLLEGIRNQDESALLHLYNEFYPWVEYYILKNSGTRSEARDVFHDAILVLYRKLKNDDLDIHTSLRNYVYGICKKLWLKELEMRRKRVISSQADHEMDILSSNSDNQDEQERIRLFQYYFSQIDEDCQRILKLYYDNASLQEISEVMGYRSMKYAKKKKAKCMYRLMKMIRKDPRFRL